jgi:phosphoribosylanthranilate isomerase
LAGGLDAGNARQAIQVVRPYALDVSSGVESGKGIKDAEKIKAFIQQVNERE